MRTLLSLCCLMLSIASVARDTGDLKGVYKRYWHTRKGVRIEQTLQLSGATSGNYTLTKTGGREDFSSGIWKKAKLWSSHDSLDVIALDPENKFETRYYLLDRRGCLTPIYEDGEQIKHANAFAPLREK